MIITEDGIKILKPYTSYTVSQIIILANKTEHWTTSRYGM